MSVHKDPHNKTWYVKYQNQTKRGFKYKKDAINYEAELILTTKNGECSRYLFDVMDEYLTIKKEEVQYTSFVKYEENVRLVMKKVMVNKPINTVTTTDCENYRIAVGHLRYATSLKNRCITGLKEVMDYAITHHYIVTNPAAAIKTFKKTNDEVIASKARESNIWTYDEFMRFMECVDGIGYKALYFTLFNTGMRLGEALALTWADFSDGKLSISKSCTKKTTKGPYEIKMPKSLSSIRTVYIDETLNQFLLDYKETVKNEEGFSEDSFMFGTSRPFPETCVQQRKNSAVRKSGVKNIRIHDFRHSHATFLINNGMNIVAVSKRLGHSDINITLKTYTHLLDEKHPEITNLLNKSSQNLLNQS